MAGEDQLLDPDQPQRWGLLRAVADELHTHVERSEDVRLDQATRDYHLGACWAWYTSTSHPPPRHRKEPLTLALTLADPVPGTCGAQTTRATWCGRFYDFAV